MGLLHGLGFVFMKGVIFEIQWIALRDRHSVTHPFSSLFIHLLLLFIISKIVLAEELTSQSYPVQMTTTSIGDGFWAGLFVKEDLLLGLQFTNHSTNFTRYENYEHNIAQNSQVVLIFNRWNQLGSICL